MLLVEVLVEWGIRIEKLRSATACLTLTAKHRALGLHSGTRSEAHCVMTYNLHDKRRLFPKICKIEGHFGHRTLNKSIMQALALS